MHVLQTFVRDSKLFFSKYKNDIDLSRSWRLPRGKPVKTSKFKTTQELKKELCGNILDSIKKKMDLQLKPT
jgi:hypothetical protein